MPNLKENEIARTVFRIELEKHLEKDLFWPFWIFSRLLLLLLNAVATWYFFITKESFKIFMYLAA